MNGGWEVDIRFRCPDGTEVRERTKSPVSGKSASQRWGEDRERVLSLNGKPKPRAEQEVKPIVTLRDFGPRFLEGYARANRQKPSGIASKETILRVHLIRRLGDKPLDQITTEDVQRLKADLRGRSPKTVNNVLTVLSVALKTAVAWSVIGRMPCEIALVPTTKPTATFLDFAAYDRLLASARADGVLATAIVMLGGDAGLRCGEMMALGWDDVNLAQRQLTVSRSEWKGHVTAPKSGRVRHIPLTIRLAEALRNMRHLRSERVLVDARADADAEGGPGHRPARRSSRQRDVGCTHLASHVLFAPGHAGRASSGHPGAGWSSGLDDDAALHAPQPGGAAVGDRAARGEVDGTGERVRLRTRRIPGRASAGQTSHRPRLLTCSDEARGRRAKFGEILEAAGT
jgi:integrase